MKRLTISFFSLFILFVSLSACEPNDDNHVPTSLRIRDFIWKGLNLYYLWQEDVPDLQDNRFANQGELNDFLRGFNEPETLFDHLTVDPSIDRFSVIYSDYRVLQAVLTGTTESNGVDFGLNYKAGSTTDIFGWVRYIMPNSDASQKNIHRGDIFYAVNGTPLTVDNYRTLLAQQSYTLNLADYDNGNITPNGESVHLVKAPYSENPVYLNTIIEQGSHKIGYLMYNGFYPAHESQLNAAFASFQSAGITDLVLDLRYNSGGSIDTATRLASMITGQFSGQVFAREQWNSKVQAYYEANNPSALIDKFTDALANGSPINSVNLSRVYVLTTKSTASASELVINGLVPYIDVIQIGTSTTGKNVGSITLYDSPTFSAEDRNRSHRYAMQPIVLRIANKDGFGDYLNGLPPDVDLAEDFSNLGVLGDATEPLLSTAIGLITGSGRMIRQSPAVNPLHFRDSKAIVPLRNEMYKEAHPFRDISH